MLLAKRRWLFPLYGHKPSPHWVLGWVDLSASEMHIFDSCPELQSYMWAEPVSIFLSLPFLSIFNPRFTGPCGARRNRLHFSWEGRAGFGAMESFVAFTARAPTPNERLCMWIFHNSCNPCTRKWRASVHSYQRSNGQCSKRNTRPHHCQSSVRFFLLIDYLLTRYYV